ncbi:MAG: Hpt domain-containing protein [Bacteroidota bacterium]|nr:Hpt domain-containing protein [Bacteroidota bacterium]MDX5404858.1 Hpt domain-containing protein [Bacteroidota bacterium]MDX5426664.1 Hpt domain-containing protein [Bacteroidota bacterium]MDX5449388.1 Hpt domain-containing protein [Bacteroidota bacterium]MDX5504668.1 Hpt domain-containing protein [Bacteroidota bacterium]
MKTTKPNKTDFHPSINVSVMEELYEGDMDHIRDMFEIFIETIPEEFDKLLSLYKDQSWEEFGRQAHKMKPTFEMVGRPDIKELFLKLELHKFDTFDPAKIDAIVNDLPGLVHEAIEISRSELQRLNA